MTRVWADLNAAQADGRACVVCGCDFATLLVRSSPAGRAADEAQVFACVAHDESDKGIDPALLCKGCGRHLPCRHCGEAPDVQG